MTTTIHKDWFYEEVAVNDLTNFQLTKVEFGFRAKNIKLLPIADYVEFSFDGVNVHGYLDPAFPPQDYLSVEKSEIWLRGAATDCMVTAW